MQCAYCSTTNVVSHRAADKRANFKPSMAEEVARLSRLNSQLANPVSGHIYDLQRRPLDFAHLEPMSEAGHAQLKTIWDQAKLSGPVAPGSEQDRRLCWTALRLADHYSRGSDALHARAVLETALDRVGDAGLCNLIRCRLATEAVAEGDHASAQGWLDECDSAPEVAELDSAYREALAQLRNAEGNPGGVLEVLGRRSGDVPIQRAFDFSASLLRIHALELGGAAQAAGEEFDRASGRHNTGRLVEALEAQGLAPGVRARQAQREAAKKRDAAAADARRVQNEAAKKRAQMNALARNRAELSTGLASLPGALAKAPFIAAALMIVVSIPRCTMDVDPLLGVQGYALCPEVCQGCEGPMWVFTEWHQTGPGEYTSDGAEYYCMPPSTAAVPSPEPIRNQSYEMSWVAAFGSTYGLLLLFVLPFVPVLAFLTHAQAAQKRRKLDAEIEAIRQELGGPEPVVKRKTVLRGLAVGVGLITAGFAFAGVLTVVALMF